MSKTHAAALMLSVSLVGAGCGPRQVVAPAPPVTPAAQVIVNITAYDSAFGGCKLKVDRRRAGVGLNQTIQWALTRIEDNCATPQDLVKIVMKWKNCAGRPNSTEPLDFDPPAAGSQTARPKPGGMVGACYQYGIFVGELFLDPEIILEP